MAGNPNSFKNKAYLIEDGVNSDISLANHVTHPVKKCTYQLLIQQKVTLL